MKKIVLLSMITVGLLIGCGQKEEKETKKLIEKTVKDTATKIKKPEKIINKNINDMSIKETAEALGSKTLKAVEDTYNGEPKKIVDSTVKKTKDFFSSAKEKVVETYKDTKKKVDKLTE